MSKWLTVRHQPNLLSRGVRVVLYLVLILPFLLVILMQAAHIGLATNIGSEIHTADGAGWVSCQSAFAQFHLASGADWCLRRPLAFMLPIPVYWLSPFSLAGVVLLQVALLSISSWALLHRLLSSFGPPFRAVLISAAAMMWLIIQYGTSAGPEALALFFSLSATTSYLRFLGSGSMSWASVATALTAAAFLARPGNPVLLVAICVLVVLQVRQRTASWRSAATPVIPVVLLFGVLNRALRSLGLSEAGHGSNLWSVVHSAADPEINAWPEVYEKYSDVISDIGAENRAFASFLRDETIGLLVSNPFPFLFQFLQNLAHFALRGFINLFSAFPFDRRSQFLALEDIARGNTSIFQWSSVWLGFLALSALILSAISALLLYRLGSDFFRNLHLRGAGVSGRRAFHQMLVSDDLRVQGVLVGAFSVFGSFIFFGAVGHDEVSRHLVMSIPWALYGVFVILSGDSSPEQKDVPRARPQSALFMSCFLLVASTALGFADSRYGTAVVNVSDRCAGPSGSTEMWRVVASAPVDSTIHLDVGADWRRFETVKTRHFDTPLWMDGIILRLSGGHIVSLRSISNGEIETVFLPDSEISDLRSSIPEFVLNRGTVFQELRSCG